MNILIKYVPPKRSLIEIEKCGKNLPDLITGLTNIQCQRKKSSRLEGGDLVSASIPTALCKHLGDLSIVNDTEVFDHNSFN